MGNSIIKEFEVDMYILLYLKRITNKDLLLIYTTWNPAQCYVAAWTGVWGSMDTWLCMAESLCSLPETITTLFVSYI